MVLTSLTTALNVALMTMTVWGWERCIIFQSLCVQSRYYAWHSYGL